MKIHVTGNAGAGKTTLAAALATQYNLPLFGLDSIVWQPGWRKTDPEERSKLEQELISKPDWVIEGVSHEVRRAADVTIFLDVPRPVCLVRCLIRNTPYPFKSRPELPEDCPEYRILPQLLKIIWRFPTRVRPDIIKAKLAGDRILLIKDAAELDDTNLERVEG